MDWHFQPHPLLSTGHLQSCVGIYLPRQYAPHSAALHLIPTIDPVGRYDDEKLALHEDLPPQWNSGDSIVLLIHGLAGCYKSTYMMRTAERLMERGHAVYRLDMRGCGAGEGLARLPAHCGRGEDVRAALEYLAELHPDSPVHAVGFSMGGMLILNMLADVGDLQVGGLVNALAIGPPIDLFDVERHFDHPGGRIYEKFFVKLLWKQALRRWGRFPELRPDRIPRRPQRLRRIDET
ncbi:alpha/beta fold hydrolase, partial [Pirellulales bacterium]|nr:alpha/beta fold hydrolase [Pirellulales bacterium]